MPAWRRLLWDGMGEDWLTQALTSRWAIAAAAFFLGVATGWLIWRAVKPGEAGKPVDDRGDLKIDPAEGGETKNGAEAVQDQDKGKPSSKLNALEAEIKQAKSILKADAEEHAAITDILTSLDEAVKRANGRLKLVVKSMKNGGNDE